MLILTRRVGESIVVGDDIVLTVFEVRGDAVRVGIQAPRSVQVHRQEVYDELKRLNEQSVSPSDDVVGALREALDPASGDSGAANLSLVADQGPTVTEPAVTEPAVTEPGQESAPTAAETGTGSADTQPGPTNVRPAVPKPERLRAAKPRPSASS